MKLIKISMKTCQDLNMLIEYETGGQKGDKVPIMYDQTGDGLLILQPL